MPFRSEAQRRKLWATRPDIARRWAREYPNQGPLPARVASSKGRGLTKALLRRRRK